jgi:hypothetical protein
MHKYIFENKISLFCFFYFASSLNKNIFMKFNKVESMDLMDCLNMNFHHLAFWYKILRIQFVGHIVLAPMNTPIWMDGY